MLYLTIHVACLGLLLVALHAAGGGVLAFAGRFLPVRARELPERMALGMGAWIAVLFALASFGWARPALLLALLGASLSAAIAAKAFAGSLRAGTRALPRPAIPAGAAARLLLALLAVVCVELLLLAALPGLGWDDSVAHLRLPRLYLEHGGFRWVRFNIYSHWPQNLQLLYMLALAMKDHVLAKMLHGSCGVLIGVAVFRACRPVCSPALALAAAALFAANPVVLEEATLGYVDLALALFLFLAFRGVAAALAGEEERQNLLLAGLFCGLAAGTKLTAWIGVASLIATWVLGCLSRGERPGAALGGALRILATAALLALPWHLKSWWETGNPVYPLLYSLFGGPEWSAALAEKSVSWQRSIGMGRNLTDWLLLAPRVILASDRDYAHFGGAISRGWIALVPFAAFAGRRDRVACAALVVALFFFFGWAASSQQMRLLIPVLPLLALAAARGAAAAARGATGTTQAAAGTASARDAAAATVAAGLLAWSAAPSAGLAVRAMSEIVLEGREGAALLERGTPPAQRAINELSPADAKILFVNVNGAFFCDREVVADSSFEASQIAEWLSGAATEEETLKLLRGEGITHVLMEREDWKIAWPPAFLALLADPRAVQTLCLSSDGSFTVFALR